MTSRRIVLPNPRAGLDWEERFLGGSAADEAAFIERAVQDIHVVQERNKKKGRAKNHDRAFHAKIHAGIVDAEFIVRDDIPVELEVGLLRAGARYPAKVRLSNASGIIQPDAAKDLRGLAAEIATEFGVHHFLGTNGSASHARNARQFIDFALAMSGSKLMLLPRLLWNLGLRETARMFKTVIRQTKRPVASLSTESYFSRSAYAFGDRAVQFRFAPAAGAHAAAGIDRTGPDFLREDIVELLKHGQVVFDFQVQLFINETLTPIEDGSAEWDSDLITIGQLVLNQQDLSTGLAQEAEAQVQAIEFNPWKTIAQFRPLGSLNRARKPVYWASVALRKGLGLITGKKR